MDHYHFIEWPDRSVPNETQSLNSLISRVNQEHPSSEWPIVVHCKYYLDRNSLS
jgi:protein tyrosine phosphatase